MLVDRASLRETGSGRAMGEVLGEQLAEHHLDDGGEQQRRDSADSDSGAGRNPDPTEEFTDSRTDHGFGDVADEETGNGDAELGT